MASSINGSPVGTALATANTTVYISHPDTVSSGDTLVLYFAHHAVSGCTLPSGFTRLGPTPWAGTGIYMDIFYKKADGTEGGGSTQVTISSSTKGAAIAVAYTAADPDSSAPGNASSRQGTNANPDPPDQSWSPSSEKIWCDVYGATGSLTTSTYPTNYSLGQLTQASGGSGSGTTKVTCGISHRLYDTVAEAPASYTISSSTDWIATMVVIFPAAGAAAGSTWGVGSVGL